VGEANRRDLPVVVVFGLTDGFPDANLRHYTFMLQGLRETQAALRDRGIRMVVRHQAPDAAALALSHRAALLVADRGYLRIQKAWRKTVAQSAPCRMLQVESDVVAPVDVVSDKEEYAARTIRPRIRRVLERFLQPVRHARTRRSSLNMTFRTFAIGSVPRSLARLRIDRSVPACPNSPGGTSPAKRLLRTFIKREFSGYEETSRDPVRDTTSHLSPYLHFGQISPLYVALQALRAGDACALSRDTYLEQLVVRRELSMNFVEFNEGYDRYTCVPDWARRTLERHSRDARDYVYTPEQLGRAETHDPYWNAAQLEMVMTGRMHNYMRMYWGKKILEWSRTPDEAFNTALYLNNKYELDGRDPNGFAGVAWCFGKHDRAWSERAVFGKVRYMSAAGLGRKFDMNAYIQKVAALSGA
jgi:deoxyribodipyrimidine photo-lyase